MSKADEDIQVILIGNKIDKVKADPDAREVPIEEAQQLANQNNFMFIETSAFSKDNVQTAFMTLLNAISVVDQRKQNDEIIELMTSR